MNPFKKPLSSFCRTRSPLDEIDLLDIKNLDFNYNAVCGYIVHSPTTAEIAHRLQTRCHTEFSLIYPQLSAEFHVVPLPESFDAAQVVLGQEAFIESDGKEDTKTMKFVITLGSWETLVTSLARGTALKPIPHYYCLEGLFNPIDETMPQSPDQYGICTSPVSAHKYMAGVMSIKPGARVITLLSNPTTPSQSFNTFIHKRSAEFTAECQERGLTVHQQIWSDDDNERVLAERIGGSDVVIVLEGQTIEVHRKALVDICNKKKIILCSTELDSVFHGASLGCGLTASAYATPLVGMVSCALLRQNIMDYTKALLPQQEGLRFNSDALRLQGVTLTEQQEALLAMRSIYSISNTEY